MKYIKVFEDFMNEKATEEWQVIWYDGNGDEYPYTIETWPTKQEATKFADSHEYDFQDEWYDPDKEDYVYKTFYRYFNPEDKDSYHGYEVKKIK